jgi:hypothetical protein
LYIKKCLYLYHTIKTSIIKNLEIMEKVIITKNRENKYEIYSNQTGWFIKEFQFKKEAIQYIEDNEYYKYVINK